MKRLLTLLAIILICLKAGNAFTESSKVWVLCQPDSYVNIRARASSRSQKEGYALCGDSFETDGKSCNGFLHVYAGIEAGEGWINSGYIVWDEPKEVNRDAQIASRGRVALRRTISGKRRKWGHDGDTLKVFWESAEWSVTSQGFVKTEYLEAMQ